MERTALQNKRWDRADIRAERKIKIPERKAPVLLLFCGITLDLVEDFICFEILRIVAGNGIRRSGVHVAAPDKRGDGKELRTDA